LDVEVTVQSRELKQAEKKQADMRIVEQLIRSLGIDAKRFTN